ncbi:SprT family zinc-dependent metalloprotease [Thiolapillus sp.]
MSVFLSSEQQQELLKITRHWVAEAGQLYSRHFPTPEVRFDLRGQTAGQYRGGDRPCIRYNTGIAAAQFDAFCKRTPPHEVAHYIMDCLHPRKDIKPHGREWRDLMRAYGLEPTRCHDYDLDKVPQRRQRRFTYTCACREHELSATRHNRVQYGKMEYRCTRCGESLRFKS